MKDVVPSWKTRPHMLGVIEGPHAVDELRRQRHAPSVDESERITSERVKDLTLEHYETAFAFQRRIYAAFGIDNTELLSANFTAQTPLCFVFPQKDVDIRGLEKELDALVDAHKIPTYMRVQFAHALSTLRQRQAWVDTLLTEAGHPDTSASEVLRRCYELVTGDIGTHPQLQSMIVTPLSIHFICLDRPTAARVVTSNKRSQNSAGSARPLTEADLAYGGNYEGMAMSHVYRPGPRSMVTVGIAKGGDTFWLGHGDATAKAKAFEIFRHELDHALFALREPMHEAADNHHVDIMQEKIAKAYVQYAQIQNEKEKEMLLNEMVDLMTKVLYYEIGGSAAVSAANEFASQYLDKDAAHAKDSVLGAYYTRWHLAEDIEKAVHNYILRLAKRLDTQGGTNMVHLLEDHNMLFAPRLLAIRTNQVTNAYHACSRLEQLGFTRHEVMDMLRLVPFNRWAVFVRRYGEELARENGVAVSQLSERYTRYSESKIAQLSQENTVLGKVMRDATKELRERSRYEHTFAYFTGGLVTVMLEAISQLQKEPDTFERNWAMLDQLLFRETCNGIQTWFKNFADKDRFVKRLTREFQVRNNRRGVRDWYSGHTAELLAHAVKKIYPQMWTGTADELVEVLFTGDEKN